MGNVEINPEKGTITYISNGEKVTISPNSEAFRNAVKARAKIEDRDSGR